MAALKNCQPVPTADLAIVGDATTGATAPWLSSTSIRAGDAWRLSARRPKPAAKAT